MSDVSAVLFAKDPTKVARFYREALGLTYTAGDDEHAVLKCGGFELVVHRMRKHDLGESKNEPVRRETGRIRLNFQVDSIDAARSVANRLGGQVDERPPGWAPRDAKLYLGHDPEGNVFKLTERALSDPARALDK